MKPGLYKFVEINGEEIRFVESFLHGPSHQSLVELGDKATAAGLVSIFDKHWKLADTYSISLRIGCNESIVPRLTQIIGKKFKDELGGV